MELTTSLADIEPSDVLNATRQFFLNKTSTDINNVTEVILSVIFYDDQLIFLITCFLSAILQWHDTSVKKIHM